MFNAIRKMFSKPAQTNNPARPVAGEAEKSVEFFGGRMQAKIHRGSVVYTTQNGAVLTDTLPFCHGGGELWWGERMDSLCAQALSAGKTFVVRKHHEPARRECGMVFSAKNGWMVECPEVWGSLFVRDEASAHRTAAFMNDLVAIYAAAHKV